MSEDFYAYMFDSHGAFIAVVQGLGMFRGRTLQELRGYVHATANGRSEGNGDAKPMVAFGLGKDLKGSYPLCHRCSGTGEVENDAQIGAQYVSPTTMFDWSLRARETCSSCEGMGVRVPGFGRGSSNN